MKLIRKAQSSNYLSLQCLSLNPNLICLSYSRCSHLWCLKTKEAGRLLFKQGDIEGRLYLTRPFVMTKPSVHLTANIERLPLVFLTRQTAMPIRFTSNNPSLRKLIHSGAKCGNCFSLCAFHFLFLLYFVPISLFPSPSLELFAVTIVQLLKWSRFISISVRLLPFTEGVGGERWMKEVTGSELKWNSLVRLRCMLLWNMQWMRKCFKAQLAGAIDF